MDHRSLSPSRRGPNLSPRTVGFWVGGVVVGTAGCILGAAMPYHHPVAVTVNVLWWGVFLGCLGASIGGLVGLWAESTRRPRESRKTRCSKRRPRARRGSFRFSTDRRRRF
jgi:hypothetical protein